MINFKYFLFISILILSVFSCVTNKNTAKYSTQCLENNVFNFSYLNKFGPQVKQHIGYKGVTIGNRITSIKEYSDYHDSITICYSFDIENVKYYTEIGKIISGNIELYDFPKTEDIFINDTTIKITDDLMYTFTENDLLINNVLFKNLDILEKNILIEPINTHIISPLINPYIQSPARTNLLECFTKPDDILPEKYLTLRYQSDRSQDVPIYISEGIIIMLFDRYTKITGNGYRPFITKKNNGMLFERYGLNISYEINAKKGWNIIWVHSETRENDKMIYYTLKTDLSQMPQNLKWIILNSEYD